MTSLDDITEIASWAPFIAATTTYYINQTFMAEQSDVSCRRHTSGCNEVLADNNSRLPEATFYLKKWKSAR